MKIGYFIGHFPYINLVNTPDYIKDYAHGGTEIAAYNLAVEMAERGNDIDVFTTSIKLFPLLYISKLLRASLIFENFGILFFSSSNPENILFESRFPKYTFIFCPISAAIEEVSIILTKSENKL